MRVVVCLVLVVLVVLVRVVVLVEGLTLVVDWLEFLLGWAPAGGVVVVCSFLGLTIWPNAGAGGISDMIVNTNSMTTDFFILSRNNHRLLFIDVAASLKPRALL